MAKRRQQVEIISHPSDAQGKHVGMSANIGGVHILMYHYHFI